MSVNRTMTKPDLEQDISTDLNTPIRIAEEDTPIANNNVIYLPDDTELDFGTPAPPETIVLPQMPRIYVSNNLTEIPHSISLPPPPNPTILPSEETKRSRGRPAGGRNYGKEANNFPFACPEPNCPRRFRLEANLEYHKKCHDPEKSGGIVCPECNAKDMNKWNVLHTHLWRQHAIDMELYACQLCAFKTPCLSSLNNIHVKIHAEEKNFKCELCASAFKNRKQLKTHRMRKHRVSLEKEKSAEESSNSNGKNNQEQKKITRVHPKVLKEARNPIITKDSTGTTTKQNGKIVLTCEYCPYVTAYRNSARRHRMIHEGATKYQCKFCEYACIQSNSFRVSKENQLILLFAS